MILDGFGKYSHPCPDCTPEADHCENCNDLGYEICSNPDHKLIDAVGGEIGRLGCPVCGHDPFYRIMSEPCSCQQNPNSVFNRRKNE